MSPKSREVPVVIRERKWFWSYRAWSLELHGQEEQPLLGTLQGNAKKRGNCIKGPIISTLGMDKTQGVIYNNLPEGRAKRDLIQPGLRGGYLLGQKGILRRFTLVHI